MFAGSDRPSSHQATIRWLGVRCDFGSRFDRQEFCGSGVMSHVELLAPMVDLHGNTSFSSSQRVCLSSFLSPSPPLSSLSLLSLLSLPCSSHLLIRSRTSQVADDGINWQMDLPCKHCARAGSTRLDMKISSSAPASHPLGMPLPHSLRSFTPLFHTHFFWLSATC